MEKQGRQEETKDTRPVTNPGLFERPVGETVRGKEAVPRRFLEVEEQDRKMISRNLYDTIGQSLAVLKLSLHRVKRSLIADIESASAEMDTIVDCMIEQMRVISDLLLPSTLDDFGLRKTLEDLFRKYTESTGIKINFHNEGLERRMPLETEATIFRIIQDTLLNVVCRGQTSEVNVDARLKTDTVYLSIAVVGNGFDSAIDNSEQAVIKERALLLGGSLTLETFPEMVRLSSELPIAGNYGEPDRYVHK
ncbi:MAG: histidine kinase [Dehalococcoidales bacterium]|nr:histidine kinase [Dehalococcoidales bacterium]